ncbi:transcriptional regulator, TetR family [gamma proteobacterium HTCC5015]|nr:transcriptional regulator, TetR family [gamma proteobacterium HTCC5015]
MFVKLHKLAKLNFSMAHSVTSIRTKNSDSTRTLLLNAALEEIQEHGFQAASLEQILSRTGLTKGALYHHFKNKRELGYSVVDELIRQDIETHWIEPLAATSDPIDTLTQLMMQAREDVVQCQSFGCPLINLGQEMSNLDEGFRERIEAIYTLWMESISSALLRGQYEGKVKRHVAPDQVASFFVAAAEGILAVGKVMRSHEVTMNSAFAVLQYLNSLRQS